MLAQSKSALEVNSYGSVRNKTAKAAADTSGSHWSIRYSRSHVRRWTAKKLAGWCCMPERSSVSFRLGLARYFPNLPKAADLYLRSAPSDCFHSGG
jgi:hypothetical protein